jgi:AcrR family transcriptional regulator
MTTAAAEIETKLRLDTKTRILNAAEKLFGQNGFDATSLRDITAEAGVNLAAVNYHFQSKESLIDALIERRLGPITRHRFEMLAAAGPNPTLEQIIRAFLAPILSHDLAPAIPLVGRVLSNPSQFMERVYKRRLGETVARFGEALHEVLPELSSEDLFWRLHFMAGAMTHMLALSSVLPQILPEIRGTNEPVDRDALIDKMVAFLAAGFRAPVDPSDVAGTARKNTSKKNISETNTSETNERCEQ